MSKSIKNRKLILEEMLKTLNPKGRSLIGFVYYLLNNFWLLTDVADDGSPNLPEQFLTG
jgi:hypothetical protein